MAQDSAPVIQQHHGLLDDAAADLGVPSRIGTGTGGAAASGLTPATVWFGALGLVVAALLLLRRRTAPVRGR